MYPKIVIIVPPKSVVRLRYPYEGRRSPFQGKYSTKQNLIAPIVGVIGYEGNEDLVIEAFCVDANSPDKLHPHKLSGKNCQNGICRAPVDKKTMKATFSGVSLYCVAKKEAVASLRERWRQNLHNFTQRSHHATPYTYNTNKVRICFRLMTKNKKRQLGESIVSDIIHQRSSVLQSAPVIEALILTNTPVTCGSEITILCEIFNEQDLAVRFYRGKKQANQKYDWEANGEIIFIHEQGVIVKTPPYMGEPDEENEVVTVFVQVYKPSNGKTSTSYPIQLVPCQPDFSQSARSCSTCSTNYYSPPSHITNTTSDQYLSPEITSSSPNYWSSSSYSVDTAVSINAPSLWSTPITYSSSSQQNMDTASQPNGQPGSLIQPPLEYYSTICDASSQYAMSSSSMLTCASPDSGSWSQNNVDASNSPGELRLWSILSSSGSCFFTPCDMDTVSSSDDLSSWSSQSSPDSCHFSQYDASVGFSPSESMSSDSYPPSQCSMDSSSSPNALPCSPISYDFPGLEMDEMIEDINITNVFTDSRLQEDELDGILAQLEYSQNIHDYIFNQNNFNNFHAV